MPEAALSKKAYLSGRRKLPSISLKACGSLAAIGGAIFGHSDEELPTEPTEGLCGALRHDTNPLV